jgi:hypothetical protein
MKLQFLTLLLIVSAAARGQNIRLLQEFDKIPLNKQRYEIEGYMSGLTDFGNAEQSKYNYDKYTNTVYSGQDHSSITLAFYDGVLYYKKLTIKYSIEQISNAKEEAENLKKYIVERNKVLSKSSGEVTNKVYGGAVGESSSYYLSKSLKNYIEKSVTFEATLEFTTENDLTKAKLIGYEVLYQSVDLSNTTLDANTGFSTP